LSAYRSSTKLARGMSARRETFWQLAKREKKGNGSKVKNRRGAQKRQPRRLLTDRKKKGETFWFREIQLLTCTASWGTEEENKEQSPFPEQEKGMSRWPERDLTTFFLENKSRRKKKKFTLICLKGGEDHHSSV